MLLKDKNQTLIIRYAALQDGGLYKCNASNRIGSAITTNTLTFLGKFLIFLMHLIFNIAEI